MKKIFTLIAAMAAVVAASAQNVWNLEGKGTEAEPYLVGSVADLQSIADRITAENTGLGEHFAMTQDIDFGGTADTPVQLPAIAKAAITNINTVAYGFDGVFDGNGHAISGIYHTNNGNDAAGKFNALFASVGMDGVIKNLVIASDNSISSYNYAAAIASVCSGRIENCVNNADITAANAFAAGICGYLVGGTGTIADCTNNGDISATTYACGIVSGAQSGSKITDYRYMVSGCTNNGTITATTGTGAAGIAGSYSGTVADCTNHGKITATKMNAAGILSAGSYAVSVTGCTNEGDIDCGKVSGGIVGNVMKGDDADVVIFGCVNKGAISAEAGVVNIGGILGNSQRVNGKVTLVACRNEGAVTGGDSESVGNLRGNESIVIGEGCTIADGLARLPLDPDDTTAVDAIGNTRSDGDDCQYSLQGVRVGKGYRGTRICRISGINKILMIKE